MDLSAGPPPTRELRSFGDAGHDALIARVEERISAGRLELPMLPQVASEIIGSGLDDGTDIHTLAGLLTRDQALAGHVLRVANSPAYAGGTRIQSIQQAVIRIGFSQLREIVVAVALRTRVFGAGGHEDMIGSLWSHSAVAAAYAKAVARSLRANVESAFLCGLLHDVGKPVVLTLTLDLAREGGTTVSQDLLRPILAAYHTAAGQQLAERWGLPDPVVESIARHHDFQAAARHARTVQITCLADVLAHWALGTGEPVVDGPAVLAHAVCPALNLYPEDVAALMEQRDAVLGVMEALGA
jgi:putative nucleotidyltransferase with HDIG domain